MLTKTTDSHTIRSMDRKKLLVPAIAGTIAVLLLVIGILGWKYYQVSKNKDDSKATSARIIKDVSKIYLLPAEEDPTVALVQDKNKLGNQEFFKKAKNGDYLLIYQKKKVALIYREETHQLVNVGPVNIGDQAQTAGASTQSEATDAP